MEDFGAVFRDYYQRVYRFLLALSGSPNQAEELTQEVFYRALLALPRYRDDGHMFTWLCTIGKNLWLNECRRQRRLEPLEGQEGAADGPEAEALRHDTRRALRRAVLELPEEYRDVVILHVYGGVPLRELAERRGKSESWGKVTFYRAKALLREFRTKKRMLEASPEELGQAAKLPLEKAEALWAGIHEMWGGQSQAEDSPENP